MNNVIPFERPKSLQQETINITDKITETLINNLSFYGIEIGEDVKDIKKLAFFIESVNALLAKDHPFHHLADKLFQDPSIKNDNIEFRFTINKVYEM